MDPGVNVHRRVGSFSAQVQDHWVPARRYNLGTWLAVRLGLHMYMRRPPANTFTMVFGQAHFAPLRAVEMNLGEWCIGDAAVPHALA